MIGNIFYDIRFLIINRILDSVYNSTIYLEYTRIDDINDFLRREIKSVFD